MVSPLPRLLTRQPEAPARAPGGLRCLWYDDRLADTLTSVGEFMRTAAAAAALAEFCRDRRDSRAPEDHARALIDAVGAIAARLRTG